MERTTFPIMLFSVLWVPLGAERVYVDVGQGLTPSNARDYCRTHYNDLAAVETEKDYTALKTAVLFYPYPDGAFWIGLYDDVSSWRWSLNESRPGFTQWASGQPDNTDGYENCVTMTTSGDWNDRNCSERQAFTCYKAEASPSFVFVNESKTWSEARDHCRVHFTDLAPVFNQTQAQALTGIMSGPGWIGLYRDSWKWTDGSKATSIKWKPGNPSGGGCVFIETVTYLLQTNPCSVPRPFICQKIEAKRTLIRLRLKTNSDLTLDQTSTALMDQLKQRWVQLGLNGNVKFRWIRTRTREVFTREHDLDQNNTCPNI